MSKRKMCEEKDWNEGLTNDEFLFIAFLWQKYGHGLENHDAAEEAIRQALKHIRDKCNIPIVVRADCKASQSDAERIIDQANEAMRNGSRSSDPLSAYIRRTYRKKHPAHSTHSHGDVKDGVPSKEAQPFTDEGPWLTGAAVEYAIGEVVRETIESVVACGGLQNISSILEEKSERGTRRPALIDVCKVGGRPVLASRRMARVLQYLVIDGLRSNSMGLASRAIKLVNDEIRRNHHSKGGQSADRPRVFNNGSLEKLKQLAGLLRDALGSRDPKLEFDEHERAFASQADSIKERTPA